MLVGKAGPDGVHVHAAQAGQGWVVELLLHAGQLVAPPCHGQQGGRGCVHMGGTVLPGHQVDDAGHGLGGRDTPTRHPSVWEHNLGQCQFVYSSNRY